MEPVSIGVVCVVIFGTVIALSAFIRQILLSRNKDMNDKAQMKAIELEAQILSNLRMEMNNVKRLDAHHHVLGDNKEAVKYLDEKIEDIFRKKQSLIERFSEIVLKESKHIVESGLNIEKKELLEKLKTELDKELEFYEQELSILQKRRAGIWDTHTELEKYLLDQEKERNMRLDNLYSMHTALFEKVFIRNSYQTERQYSDSLSSSDLLFKVLAYPLNFIMQFFSLSSNINIDKWLDELKSRHNVENKQADINDTSDNSTNAPPVLPNQIPAPSPS